MNLSPELKASAIAPDIARLNFQQLTPEECFEYLLYGLPESERRNDGRLRDKWLSRYGHLYSAGWWCSGIDILTGQDSLWGCLKPTVPKLDSIKGKAIKYEHPPKVPTEVFFLKVPAAIARKIAVRHNLEANWLEANFNGLSFWEWVKANPIIKIIITEGAKKAASLLSAGFCAVALPGIFNGYRTPKNEHGEKIGLPYLIPQMAAIAQKSREFVLCFDNDSKPATVKNVQIAISRTTKLLLENGCQGSVMIWGDKHPSIKGIDDVHSLFGAASLEEIYDHRLSYGDWYKLVFKLQQQKAALERWRQFTPDLSLQLDYLTGESLMQAIAPHLSGDGLAVFIRSGLGTNKTGSVGDYLQALNPDRGVILISDINRLLYQTVERWNDDKKNQALAKLLGHWNNISHLHLHEAYDLICSDEFLAACMQSLQRWQDDGYFDGKILVIDEVCSVIRSFLDGDTLKREGMQGMIAHKFEALFKRCSLILCLDGNLNDETADLITKLSGKPALKIQNTPVNPKLYPFKLWDDKKLLTAFGIEQIKAGHRVAFTSDNAAENRLIYRQLIELGIQPEQIVIIDQDSTPKECPQALYDKPTEYLKAHPEVLVLLYSPAANRGFDFDGEAIREGISLFDYLIGCFEGIISADQVDQQLFRFRDERLQRHIWLSDTGKPNPRPHSYSQKSDDLRDALKAIEHGIPSEIKAIAVAGIEQAIAAFEQSPWVAYEKQMRTVNEYEQQNFKTAVIELLEAKGCAITPAFKPDNDLINASANGYEARKAIKEQIRAEKKAETNRRAAAMAIAPSHSVELESLKAADPAKYESVTPADIARKNRYEVALPSFTTSKAFTSENIAAIEEKPEIIQALTRFVMLNHEELAIAKLEANLHRIVTHHRDTGLTPWLGDINTEALTLKTYNHLGIPNFIKTFSKQTFTKDSSEVVELLTAANRKSNKKHLGISIGKDSIKAIKKLIKRNGFTLETKHTNSGNTYRVIPILHHELHHQICCSLRQKIRADHTPKTNWLTLQNEVTDHPLVCIEKQDNVSPIQTHSYQGLESNFSPEKKQPEKREILATVYPVTQSPNQQTDHNQSKSETMAIAQTQIHENAEKDIPEPVAEVAIPPKLPWDILGAVQDAIMALTTGDKKPMRELCNRLQNASIIHQAISQLEDLGATGFNETFISQWMFAR